MKKILVFIILLVLQTTFYAQDWKLIKGTENATNFYFIDESTGWFVKDNYSLYKTSDGGKSWKMQVTESSALDYDEGIKDVFQYAYGNQITALYFFNDKNGIIGLTGFWGNVCITEDGGNKWNDPFTYKEKIDSAKGEAEYVSPFSFYFFNEKEGFACGRAEGDYAAGFYKTSDGGNSFWKVNVDIYNDFSKYNYLDDELNSYIPYNPDLNKICFVNSKIGWAIGNHMYLFTKDGGTAWVRDTTRTYNNLIDICFINDSTGWIVAEGGILMTRDGGINYKMIYEDENFDMINSVIFLDEKNGFAGTGIDSTEDEEGTGKLLKTTDSGNSWTTVLTAKNAFSKLQLIKGKAVFVGGKDGIYMLNLK